MHTPAAQLPAYRKARAIRVGRQAHAAVFATPAGSPPQYCIPYRMLHARCERVGCFHRSRAIFLSPVPNPTSPIRMCAHTLYGGWVPAPRHEGLHRLAQDGDDAAGGGAHDAVVEPQQPRGVDHPRGAQAAERRVVDVERAALALAHGAAARERVARGEAVEDAVHRGRACARIPREVACTASGGPVRWRAPRVADP
jgi:hypothetical protein